MDEFVTNNETLEQPANAEASQAVELDESAQQAAQQSEGDTAVDPGEVQRREHEKAQAQQNAAFAAMRQQAKEAREQAAQERAGRERAEAERQQLMQRLLPQQQASQQGDGPPDPSKYAGGEFAPEYVRDMSAYTARAEFARLMRGAQEQQQQVAQRQAQAQALANWEASQKAAQSKYSDFEVVVEASGAQIPKQALVLMAGLKDGAELLYHASKDPDKAKSLSGNPAEVAAALGELRAEVRYAAKLEAARVAAEESTNAPITPGNAGARSSGEPDLAGENPERWIAWRRKQLNSR